MMMSRLVTFLFVFTVLLNAKDIVVITDISVEPTQKGLNDIQGQLEQLLYFDIEEQAPYLKFGDKVTMAYMNNRAEEASAYNGNLPTFDLSQENFDEFGEEYLDHYLDTAIGYMNDVISVEKQKIEVSKKKNVTTVKKPQNVLIAVDRSESMESFRNTVDQSILKVKQIDAENRRYNMIESTGQQLGDLLLSIKPPLVKEQLILYTDGIDDTTENLRLVNTLKKQGYMVYPMYLSKKWDKNYLSQLSSVQSTLYNDETIGKHIQKSFYDATKTEEKTVFEKFPHIPIIESIRELSKHSFLSTDTPKEIFILSSLMQNSKDFSFKEILENDLKLDAQLIADQLRKIDALPDLKGHNITVLRVGLGAFEINNQMNVVDAFWKDFLKLCGAKNVSVHTAPFKLR